MTFEEAAAFALSLPGTEASTHYGKTAVKVASTGRSFVSVGNEPDTSFVIAIDRDTVAILIATDPATFWQTPHYQGWPAVLVRYDSPDPVRIGATIAQARDGAAAGRRVRPRASGK